MPALSAGVPEWPKGSDCKSDARASMVRIHPPAPYYKALAVVEALGLWPVSD